MLSLKEHSRGLVYRDVTGWRRRREVRGSSHTKRSRIERVGKMNGKKEEVTLARRVLRFNDGRREGLRWKVGRVEQWRNDILKS